MVELLTLQCLLVLDYMIKGGSERVIDNATEHIYNIRTLKDFQYTDEDGIDQGLNGMVDE